MKVRPAILHVLEVLRSCIAFVDVDSRFHVTFVKCVVAISWQTV